MIFDLLQDSGAVLDAMPREHPRWRLLELLDNAIRRDAHFINRHPTTFFQCMWNTCRWQSVDASHLSDVEASLRALLVAWHTTKLRGGTVGAWLRSLSPPRLELESPLQAVFQAQEAVVTGVGVSRTMIMAGTRSGAIFVWSRADSALLWSVHRHGAPVVDLLVSADESRLVSRSLDGSTRLWNLANFSEVAYLRGRARKHEVEAVSLSPTRNEVATGARDGSVRCFDLQSGAEMFLCRGHAGAVTCLEFLPCGKRLASASADGTVRLWHCPSGTEQFRLETAGAVVTCLAASADGTLLAAADSGGMVRLWTTPTGGLHAAVQSRHANTSLLQFTVDALFGIDVRSARLWRWARRDTVAPVVDVCELGGEPKCAMFITQADAFAVGYADGTIRKWDVKGTLLGEIRGHDREVTCCAVAPDGTCICSGSDDRTIRLWRSEFGGIRQRQSSPARIATAAFSPDGRTLLGGSSTGEVTAWNTHDGVAIWHVSGHEGQVDCLAVSADGTRFVSGANDGTVVLGNLSTGRVLNYLRHRGANGGTVTSAVFSSDGELCATGGSDYMVRIWDVTSGKQLAELGRHNLTVRGLRFAQQDRFLLSWAYYTVHVWDWRSGVKRLEIPMAPSTEVEPPHFSIPSPIFSYRAGVKCAIVDDDDDLLCDAADLAALVRTRFRELVGKDTLRHLALFRGDQWMVYSARLETVVERATTREAVAWLPGAVTLLDIAPGGACWAARIGDDLVFARVES